ncbi:MAG: hypothetical protein KatS3mg036_0498 [Ignavibacterium sp.]|uniref:hypothetical protein n=1 Tax=Ignavibacterium sp. TaxID=2651167 RepID=UPI0021DD6DDA|nr:hypothetical protein [Ignavibacterium sp.]BDQ01944.1 MAG: hypothetical protein KatS3mg037_0519 [Ignavibacterium sp.]GIV45680.1 MAG: hypothetical protein KatS3mg036_0498 [Ignavibacterium sp.]
MMDTDLNKNQGTPDAKGNSGKDGDDSAPKNPEEKTFTQDEVNQIIQARLAKEKDKYKDYESLKSQIAELEQLKEKSSKLESETSNLNSVLQEVYDSLVQSVDEDKRTLIPEQLSLADKIKYINSNRATLLTPQPKTPPKEPNPKGEPGLFGGKYSTLVEFASKDPKGYYEARKAGKI